MAIPEKIGRYEIKSELGRGGFATVYRAYDPRFEREVAIKFMPPELVHADPQFRMRFEREEKIIAQLEHPAIVPVYDVGEENNQPYFVMRYMSGGSLSDLIKGKKITIEEAVRIIEQIAPGLDEAHSKGIIHRDLKPANILFTNRGVPLISDFGIAKFSQGEAGGNMTGSAIIGTPAYMAPEQASGDTIDGRADIYALGVILYEMVTGKQPYQADTPLGLAIKHITDPVPRILEANPSLPTWMEKVISTAMAKDPEERFSTAVELVETIKAFLRGETPQVQKANETVRVSPFNKTAAVKTGQIQQPQPSSEQKRRSPVLVIAGVVLLLAVLGGGAFLFGGDMLQQLMVVSTPTITAIPPNPTNTLLPIVIEVTATSLPTSTVEPTATVAPSSGLPIVGGADKLAFLRNNDLWVMNMDTTEPKQLTRDGVAKFNLQWLPGDGDNLIYMTGKTVKKVNIETGTEETIFNFLSAEYFEAFRVSPDGKQVAIAVNRELHVVPFDLEKLANADRKSELIDMDGCLFYNDLAIKDVRWSDDGTKLSIKYIANLNSKFADAIRIMDITRCNSLPPGRIDDFPAGKFSFANDIINFDWDGDLLFIFNSDVRNDGFGDLMFYNAATQKPEKVAPFENNCCYRDAAFSPDGTFVIFAFQDIRLGSGSPINLYLVTTDSLSQPRTLDPLPLPEGFFTKNGDKPMPVMRPVQP
ncbi:MAG: serine/threonine-protein kinase [Anaerolineales bacterium]|nr:serine/threonine-protein kinase [Anaerolineales bacterium]